MMLNEIYVVNESGQLEMNFEALELITDDEFVYFIKLDLENRRTIFHLNQSEHYVEVFTVGPHGGSISIHKHDRSSGEYSLIVLNKLDVEKMSKAVGGRYL